jgi:hypothetical protein
MNLAPVFDYHLTMNPPSLNNHSPYQCRVVFYFILFYFVKNNNSTFKSHKALMFSTQNKLINKSGAHVFYVVFESEKEASTFSILKQLWRCCLKPKTLQF